MSWLGRGFEAVPGKPFGWAFNRETDEIREHLIRRGYDPNGAAIRFRISKIRERLWRNRPTFRERQAAWLAKQPKAKPRPEPFTPEELERLVELFAGANDPVTASIGAKAKAMLE